MPWLGKAHIAKMPISPLLIPPKLRIAFRSLMNPSVISPIACPIMQEEAIRPAMEAMEGMDVA